MNEQLPTPPHSPGIPPEVSHLELLLSGQMDGDLSHAETVELAELIAGESDATTAAAISEVSRQLKLLNPEQAGSAIPLPDKSLRAAHLATALEAASSPEVASLSAARVKSSTAGSRLRTSFTRRSAAPVGYRWLSAAAAGLVVVAGFGILAGQLGGSGSDSDSAAGQADPTASKEITSLDEGDAVSPDIYSADDSAMATAAPEADLAESAAGSSDRAQEERLLLTLQRVDDPRAVTEFSTAPLAESPPTLSTGRTTTTGVPSTDQSSASGEADGQSAGLVRCTLLSSGELLNYSRLQPAADFERNAVTGVALAQVAEKIFEVYRLADGELVVLDQSTCTQVD